MSPMPGPFGGRVAVVTGGGRGIGFSIASGMAELGARVVVLESDRIGLEACVEMGIDVLKCDVANEDDVQKAAAHVEIRHRRCDVLVNNAGVITMPKALESVSLVDWNYSLNVNLVGPFLCMKAFFPLLRAQGGGTIVNIGSVASDHPSISRGSYSASKAGLTALTRQAAVEWARSSVRVNMVSPGMIETCMSGDVYEEASERARRDSLVPMGRIGLPADVRDVVLFLASDSSRYVTGEEVTVDGGLSATLLATISQGLAKPDANSTHG